MNDILFEATRFRVEQVQYTIPDVGPVQRELVVHPGAVTILPLLAPDRVILIRNYRFSAGKELLELPAGTLEPEEAPAACAHRELEEETGYVAGKMTFLSHFYTSPGFTNELMHAYVATDLRQTKQALDETEQIRVEPMSLNEALAAAADGRIVDGKTIAILMLYHYRQVSNP